MIVSHHRRPFLGLVDMHMDRHHYQTMNQMSTLDIFHLRRHKKQHYDRASASYLVFDLALQMASSYSEIDYDYVPVAELGGIHLLLLLCDVVQSHLRIRLVLRNMNGFWKWAGDYNYLARVAHHGNCP